MKTKNREQLYKQFIDDRFISHYKKSIIYGGCNIVSIMEKNGVAECRISWYDNKPSEIILHDLSVSAEFRRQGIGTELQKIRENIGRGFEATTAVLSVVKDSWMYDWYIRRGYVEYANREPRGYEGEEKMVWMEKDLTLSDEIPTLLKSNVYICPECGKNLHVQLLDKLVTDAFCFACKKDIDVKCIVYKSEWIN